MTLTTSSTTFNPTFGGKKKKKKIIDAVPDQLKAFQDYIEKEIKKVLVHPKKGNPFYRTIDTEHMSEIGKKGFAVTSKKIADMINDPNADSEDVGNLARWFARRIKNTTTTYRSLWWREFRKNLKSGANREKATRVASEFISEMTGHG